MTVRNAPRSTDVLLIDSRPPSFLMSLRIWVKMCPALNRRVKILTSQKRIIYEPTNSFYQVLSAEAYSKHGFNIHGVVFDELHTQPNRKLFDVMTKGSGDARMQPLYFLITTAEMIRTPFVMKSTRKHRISSTAGRSIQLSIRSFTVRNLMKIGLIRRCGKRPIPLSVSRSALTRWRRPVNPRNRIPASENAFRQLRLNQWVKQSVRWMPMDKWDACAFSVSRRRSGGAHLLRRAGLIFYHGYYSLRAGVSTVG